jgi:tetratricopeptide (TPR) repeat protein
MLFRDEKSNKFDLHPIVRKYCYEQLKNKESIHLVLADYFAYIPASERIESVEDLAPVIELYHHTVRAGRYYEALVLFYDRVKRPLYFKFGAYQTIIELLSALFYDSIYKHSRLKSESNQAWTLNELANAYLQSGNSQSAVNVIQMVIKLDDKLKSKGNAAISLINLANLQMLIGKLDSAETNLRRSIDIPYGIKDKISEEGAIVAGHTELGRVLAYKGEFENSKNELDLALKSLKILKEFSPRYLNYAYRSLYFHLQYNAEEAFKSAKKAREMADVEHFERDIIRAEYLLGAAHLMKGNLADAENHLIEALTRDRKINHVEFEPDILLELAKLRFTQNHKEEALKFAEEALLIADRCEYRLKQADIHNFLAEFYMDVGGLKQAKKHGEIAKERAECGYKPALEKAEKFLNEI